MAVFIHEEVEGFSIRGKNNIKHWIKRTINAEGKCQGSINIVFLSDEALLKMNEKYLSHHYYTDIITFNYNKKEIIEGDLYISIERIKENAEKFNVTMKDELLRVMIHGILHLLGYDDKSNDEKKRMRILEGKNLKRINKEKINVNYRI